MRDTENMEAEVEYDDEEEPSFSDPEDFVDDISDEGKRGLRFSPPANGLRVTLDPKAQHLSPRLTPTHFGFIV